MLLESIKSQFNSTVANLKSESFPASEVMRKIQSIVKIQNEVGILARSRCQSSWGTDEIVSVCDEALELMGVNYNSIHQALIESSGTTTQHLMLEFFRTLEELIPEGDDEIPMLIASFFIRLKASCEVLNLSICSCNVAPSHLTSVFCPDISSSQASLDIITETPVIWFESYFTGEISTMSELMELYRGSEPREWWGMDDLWGTEDWHPVFDLVIRSESILNGKFFQPVWVPISFYSHGGYEWDDKCIQANGVRNQ